jgi:hypothetical protein
MPGGHELPVELAPELACVEVPEVEPLAFEDEFPGAVEADDEFVSFDEFGLLEAEFDEPAFAVELPEFVVCAATQGVPPGPVGVI